MKLARALAAVAVVAAMAGCSLTPTRDVSVATVRSPVPRSPVPRSPVAQPPRSRPPVQLVAWHGPVEQLFVHPLVLRPRLAFTNDPLGRGFADYFITAREFGRILDQLWRNGWTLVDPRRVAADDVRVPPGRKPLVLQEDDVNYYAYFNGRGLASRLVVAPDGTVKAEYDGHLTDDDVVPMTDAEVALHPEFSADGAKGLLAVTAYEGFFGEHNLKDPAARHRLESLVAALDASGWVIASHTYGHINLSADSLSVIARDTSRWKAAAQGLLGAVNILVYPFGARPDPAARKLLRAAGFTVQYDIDVRPARWKEDGVVMMSRRHIDGYAFANPKAMAPFFSVRTVRDPLRP